MVAYNLKSIKDDPTLLPIVMNEIFFRVTRLFENPDYRSVPKYLDVDEAHALLRIPHILDFLVRGVRTWGKYLAGVGLWTQSPKEFQTLEHWPALRAAASTFFFLSDPQMDANLYQNTFALTDGECDTIRSLKPKREAFIIQREIGIAKKVILQVEPEQYVISTSKPADAVVRARNFQRLGFELGLKQTVRDLRLDTATAVDPDEMELQVTTP